MRFETLLKNPANWMTGSEGHHDVVLTSRVRLARNVSANLFPGWAKKEQRITLVQALMPEIAQLPEMSNAFSKTLDQLSALEKQVLVERHLISREQAARGEGSAAVINQDQTLSLLLNEEDHLRLQGIQAGLSLGTAYHLVSSVDEKLQEKVSFAFDHDLGYLTACPTNLGTGMRASAMLHLPGLVLAENIKQVLNASNQHQYAVRGIYGEGTESLGNLFQISNQSTLGQSEEEIISGLERFIHDLVEAEENARLKLLEDNPDILQDHVGRAYGILKNAYVISSVEALNLLSLIRLGASLGFLPAETYGLCDQLLMNLQPAHLQLYAEKDLNAEERDIIRAEIIRTQLQTHPAPVMVKSEHESLSKTTTLDNSSPSLNEPDPSSQDPTTSHPQVEDNSDE